MEQKRNTIRLLLIAITFLSLWYLLILPVPSLGVTSISMLDVGQGDSFFIQTKNGKQMLIDGGRDAGVLAALTRVLPRNDRSIDVVIATHPDMDHVGGLSMIVARYKVGAVLVSGVQGDTEAYRELLERIHEKGIPLVVARAGMKLSFSDSESFTVLFPDRDVFDWETNTASVVGVLRSGKRGVFLSGDSPVPIEQYLVKKDPAVLDVDILKLGHHGSRTSTSAALLRVATPEVALISAGRDNSYGHPHNEVLTLLHDFDIPYLSTQTEGTVTFQTDGTTWWRK